MIAPRSLLTRLALLAPTVVVAVTTAAAATAAAAPASAPGAAQATACPQLFPAGAPPALSNPKLARDTAILCNDDFAVVASGVTRGALWSAEHLTTRSLAAARELPRLGRFHPDGRLPPGTRAELEDYRGSGFDRGHMTPSGDMPSPRSQSQTYALSNVVPQTAELNRGVWVGVESAVRHLAGDRGELYVVTGPAFQAGQLSQIGPDGVLVPTATWKAIYLPDAAGAGAYYCHNTTQPTCETISVATLAQRVGIDPFPALPSATKARLLVLPAPEDSPYAASAHGNRRHPRPWFLDQLSQH